MTKLDELADEYGMEVFDSVAGGRAGYLWKGQEVLLAVEEPRYTKIGGTLHEHGKRNYDVTVFYQYHLVIIESDGPQVGIEIGDGEPEIRHELVYMFNVLPARVWLRKDGSASDEPYVMVAPDMFMCGESDVVDAMSKVDDSILNGIHEIVQMKVGGTIDDE